MFVPCLTTSHWMTVIITTKHLQGQTILLSEPKIPLKRMTIWTQPSVMGPNEFSHVFPRPLGGGVIIGGVRLDNDWDETFDLSRVDNIKNRACKLVPELGKPEDLQVVRYNVGLRRTFSSSVDHPFRRFRLTCIDQHSEPYGRPKG
jgi:glycine/D-amino acid oxidase-like deaminating enzyme